MEREGSDGKGAKGRNTHLSRAFCLCCHLLPNPWSSQTVVRTSVCQDWLTTPEWSFAVGEMAPTHSGPIRWIYSDLKKKIFASFFPYFTILFAFVTPRIYSDFVIIIIIVLFPFPTLIWRLSCRFHPSVHNDKCSTLPHTAQLLHCALNAKTVQNTVTVTTQIYE